MYLARDSFCVSFKWVVIISIKQEAAHTQSAKVSTCYTLWHFWDWSLIRGKRGAGGRGRGATKRQGRFTPSKSVGSAGGPTKL